MPRRLARSRGSGPGPLVAALLSLLPPRARGSAAKPFATGSDDRRARGAGWHRAAHVRALTEAYSKPHSRIDRSSRAPEVNPDALAIADALDADGRRRDARVLARHPDPDKDNIATATNA